MVDSYICTIAIADDHLHMRQVVRQIIESFGYNIIIEAEDGQKLIDKIISGSVPDICVLDMNMPFLNGVQTTRILKERWPSIKIAIFSMSDRMKSLQPLKTISASERSIILKIYSAGLNAQPLSLMKYLSGNCFLTATLTQQGLLIMKSVLLRTS